MSGAGERGGEVALARRERVRGRGALEEEEREEDEELRPRVRRVRERVDAEGLEGGEHDEHGRPAVVEREGEVHEELVSGGLRRVMLLDDVVDVLGAPVSGWYE